MPSSGVSLSIGTLLPSGPRVKSGASNVVADVGSVAAPVAVSSASTGMSTLTSKSGMGAPRGILCGLEFDLVDEVDDIDDFYEIFELYG